MSLSGVGALAVHNFGLRIDVTAKANVGKRILEGSREGGAFRALTSQFDRERDRATWSYGQPRLEHPPTPEGEVDGDHR
jgi:hypothetical protein